MIDIKTYQDLIKVGEAESNRIEFVLNAIEEHQSSVAYQNALIAEDYLRGENTTIMNYEKLLYTLTGNAVPDRFTANHKCASGFFNRFITQECSYLLKNGVAFEKDETSKKLGEDFNEDLYKYTKSALAQSVVFGFYDSDHVEFFKFTEFVPLYDEEDGSLKAGIRFWQIDETKPLRATLYELDGYTKYFKADKEEMKVLEPKRTYQQIVKTSEADGTEIYDGDNYPNFPIVPLYANVQKQSELVGMREQIDCYDLIKSGFANDLDDASLIYWTIQNAGGMDDEDLAQFIERMKTVHAATVDEDGASAEAHTMDVPYQSREVYLARLEKDLYKDFMALDTEQIAAGNVTATQIEAAYEPLDEKAYELKTCIVKFIKGIFEIAGIDDNPVLTPHKIANIRETVETVLMTAEYLDDETILRKIPFLTDDEIDGILDRKVEEDMDRFDTEEAEETEEVEDAEDNEFNNEFANNILKQLEGLLGD